MELSLFVLALLAAGAVLTLRRSALGVKEWCVLSGCGLVVLLGLVTRDLDGDPVLRAGLPDANTDEGFVSSATCKSCHPAAYHSWHDSYHRSMTQPASPESVVGDFDDVTLTNRGKSFRLERRGDEFWIEMEDPAWFSTVDERRVAMPQRGWFRVVMTTGSHHLQTYWVRRSKSEFSDGVEKGDGLLMQIPWVWLAEEERWAPNQDSFLTPEKKSFQLLLPWLTSCNMCHSVATQPHLAEETDASRSAELGIACEACHGPGREHVLANLSPLRRYQRHLASEAGETKRPDPTIVNPARLPKERSAEVCGQCHSFNKELDMDRWSKTGVAFRPGDELAKTKAVFKFTKTPTHPRLLEHMKFEPEALQGRFWEDGTIRVAGREYNGLIESKCYTHGSMTCLSCHSLHGYDKPKDQLEPKKPGDASCLQCHADYGDAAKRRAHTHHAAGSGGERCMNCHMPHTTYGLFVAMRSHRVDSPSVSSSVETGRPNACNICHLDKTLAWTAEKMTEWYGHDPVEMTQDQKEIAASILWVTAGNAPQRAILTWAMGWKEAQRASGRSWQPAFLGELLSDPYAVIRQVAFRSLRSFDGFSQFQFDYVAPKKTQYDKSRDAIVRWMNTSAKKLDRYGPHLLLEKDGRFHIEEHSRLLKARDNRPISIIE